MPKTPEKKVKDKVTAQLRDAGAYYFFPFSGGYGKSGVPDIICCYRGKFFAFECKAGNNKPTDLQRKHIDDINAEGGHAFVINEENVHEVADLLFTS